MEEGKKMGWKGATMKEAFDLIRKRMREELTLYEKEIQIVSEVEEEYGNGKTNADRIRAMSDEELAEFLCGVFDEDECDGKYIFCITIPNYDEEKITEWLKSTTTD